MSGGQKETFSVEGVRSSLERLENYFDEVGKQLDSDDSFVNNLVNAGPKSAIWGEAGAKLLNIWNENASTFGNFKSNFAEWSKMVALITANNINFSADTINEYKNDGSNLAGIQTSRNNTISNSYVESTDEIYNKWNEIEKSDYKAPTNESSSQGGSGVARTNYDSSSGSNGTGENVTQQAGATSVGLGEKIGGRYVDSWNDFTGDVKDRWSDAHGLLSGVGAIGLTGVEFSNFLADVGRDTTMAVVDTVDWGANWLFDLSTGRGGSTTDDYWKNIGQDYAENWDYSNVDNVWEGIGVTIGGVLRTGVDVVQTGVNAVATAADWATGAASDVVDWVGDAAGTLFGWLF